MDAASQPGIFERSRLHARTARRAMRRYGFRPGRMLRSADERMVFIVGSPRSGTSLTADALGNLTGFADLGEVNLLKASIPYFYCRAREAACKPRVEHTYEEASVAQDLRHLLIRSQRFAMVTGRRAIEQTPESSFLIPELSRAFPRAQFVHVLRDGRDAVCSLIERGWLAGSTSSDPNGAVVARGEGNTHDDAGQPFGGHARFWVEEGREAGFEKASEMRRCAWAWRRYVTATLEGLEEVDSSRVTTLRYEELVADTPGQARRLAGFLGAGDQSERLIGAFSSVHAQSVGRYRTDLTPADLELVEAEAGAVLRKLGYPVSSSSTD